jgi:hypothetical protein
MTKLLTLDEMLEVLIAIGHPAADALQTATEGLATAMAQMIARDLDVAAGAASFRGTAFAGTCAPFRPSFRGQPCPESLTHYDSGEWDEPELVLLAAQQPDAQNAGRPS